MRQAVQVADDVAQAQTSGVSAPSVESKTRVIVTDVDMPFGSMVTFMLKWTFASIPAVLILYVIVFILAAVFGPILGTSGR